MGYIEDLRAAIGTRPVILVGAVCAVLDDAGRLLLQRRTEGGGWGLPGGLMELGESGEETARREVEEETGLRLGELRMIDVFSGPEYYVKMRHGDEFYSVTIAYAAQAREASGELVADPAESLELRYFPLDELPQGIVTRHRMMLDRMLDKMLETLKVL
ncbi:MAG TPA: NUDIX domain-containing protein [Bacilli bacterium]|nr:NUDIX domain-containing protein [Bacilli bacterium]